MMKMIGAAGLYVGIAIWTTIAFHLDSGSQSAAVYISCVNLLFVAVAVRLLPQAQRVSAAVGAIVVFTFSALTELFATGVGIYEYRGRVPLYVPVGHAALFLAAFVMARNTRLTERLRIPVIGSALALVIFSVVRQCDELGLLWFGAWLAFMAWREARGTVLALWPLVEWLEYQGTSAGLWIWKPTFLGVCMGNPPASAAGGYCFFAVAGLAVIKRLGRSGGSRRVLRAET